MKKLQNIARAFRIAGDFVDCRPYGSGHINDTYKLTLSQAGATVNYILQRINTNVFPEPEKLMENIARVTGHLAAKLDGRPDASRRTLTVTPTADGAPCHVDDEGGYWRCYLFIENALSYDVADSPSTVGAAARAFGEFQRLLADFPPPRLHEVIPDFHHTPKRVDALEAAVKADVKDRVKLVRRELDFVASRREECGKLLALNAAGAIPERITHNDTKLNNVLIDASTGEGVCVIDLDTVMPGLVHYDFGDMVRTGTNPAAEDETDLDKVYMRFDLFEAILRGFASSAGAVLTPAELENLPFSGKLITLEIGVRFLTDFLRGDVYFKTKRENHNLDRCRTQFKLVESIEEQFPKMMNLLKELEAK